MHTYHYMCRLSQVKRILRWILDSKNIMYNTNNTDVELFLFSYDSGIHNKNN